MAGRSALEPVVRLYGTPRAWLVSTLLENNNSSPGSSRYVCKVGYGDAQDSNEGCGAAWMTVAEQQACMQDAGC